MNEVALVVLTNGRDEYLHQTLESLRRNVAGLITTRVIYDDTGDVDHAEALARRYLQFTVVLGPGQQGFGGATAALWEHTKQCTSEPYVLWCEDDFTFNGPVYLDALASVLEVNPQLGQLALRRQAWNIQEKAAGGVVELAPASYTDRVSGSRRYHWLEHTNFWTTNPSLIPRCVVKQLDWPATEHSEGLFTQVAREAGYRFGYWGARGSGTWVTHIGNERTGHGY